METVRFFLNKESGVTRVVKCDDVGNDEAFRSTRESFEAEIQSSK